MLMEHYVCIKYNSTVCLLIMGFCVIQQFLLNLNPILSGAALESIHLMNNATFNLDVACSTCLLEREDK